MIGRKLEANKPELRAGGQFVRSSVRAEESRKKAEKRADLTPDSFARTHRRACELCSLFFCVNSLQSSASELSERAIQTSAPHPKPPS